MASFFVGDQTKLVRGAARIMIAPAGTDKPGKLADVIDLSTYAAIDPWTDLGFTIQGIQININNEESAFDVDQVQGAIGTAPTGWSANVTTQLAEETGANLLAAQGYGTVTTTPASAGVRGMEDYDIPGGVPNVGYHLAAVEGQFQNGEAFRAVLWKTLPASTGAMTITKNGKATIPFTHRALPDATTNPTRVARLRKILAAL